MQNTIIIVQNSPSIDTFLANLLLTQPTEVTTLPTPTPITANPPLTPTATKRKNLWVTAFGYEKVTAADIATYSARNPGFIEALIPKIRASTNTNVAIGTFIAQEIETHFSWLHREQRDRQGHRSPMYYYNAKP